MRLEAVIVHLAISVTSAVQTLGRAGTFEKNAEVRLIGGSAAFTNMSREGSPQVLRQAPPDVITTFQTPVPTLAPTPTPTIAPTNWQAVIPCGNHFLKENAPCKEHVLFASTTGRLEHPDWYVQIEDIAGVTLENATVQDFQRLFFCKLFGQAKQCGQPPCFCTSPPCNLCQSIPLEARVVPTPAPTPQPTLEPTPQPTLQPTFAPTMQPTLAPTIAPTPLMTFTAAPTVNPMLDVVAQKTMEADSKEKSAADENLKANETAEKASAASEKADEDEAAALANQKSAEEAAASMDLTKQILEDEIASLKVQSDAHGAAGTGANAEMEAKKRSLEDDGKRLEAVQSKASEEAKDRADEAQAASFAAAEKKANATATKTDAAAKEAKAGVAKEAKKEAEDMETNVKLQDQSQTMAAETQRAAEMATAAQAQMAQAAESVKAAQATQAAQAQMAPNNGGLLEAEAAEPAQKQRARQPGKKSQVVYASAGEFGVALQAR